ncbi:glycosyltransferase [Pseudonocardia sp. H11422]|uniref:glycosyltransferase n=1 Tax=Pseudonocardia sp. H11422 TaxID=2835866 RepID=UPI001BDC5200|nr:glycosyltransferase [Pseudonocardia sp. H11422]
MRIAMVSEHASPLAAPGGPDSGGQNVHVRELSRALAAAGHDVTVWTRRDAPTAQAEAMMAPGIRVRHVTAGPAARLPKDELVPHVPELAHQLRRAWAADLPDVVHAHFWMSGLASLAAAGRLGIPLVQTFHALGHVKRRHQGVEDSSPGGRIPAERAIACRVDRVIATCSDEVFELVRLGAPRSRITVVPCGVDSEAFTPQGPESERGGRPRVVSIGRLVRRKGVDEVIEALSRIPAAELLVAGGSRPGEAVAEDPDVRRLQALARARGVAGRVRFLGAVPRPDVPALLRSADVVVCVPWYEPFGMVPLEAMACGRPVVVSAVGGMTDTVIDQVTGLHVPPRRPDVLARSLRGLLAQPTLQLALGAAGRDRAVARYGWNRVGAATAEVYQQVIAARAHRPERLTEVSR